MCILSSFNRVQLFMTLQTIALQAPRSMEFSKQENQSGLPCPPPEYLPDPGMVPVSLTSPALAGRFFTTKATWKTLVTTGPPGNSPFLPFLVHLSQSLGSLWDSLVAQLVKNLPAMRETWVRSLGCEDPLEKGKATHSSILAWRISWILHGVAKSQT